MTPADAYTELVERSRERSLLNSCASLLGWDEQTYMPRGGAEHRSRQHALLAGLVHERGTDPRLGELLALAESSELCADPESVEAVNIREWRRSFDRARKLPRALVEELARATSLGQQAWIEAKQARSFAKFQPSLEAILNLKRREAACLGTGESDYDALLDDYEPGAKASELAPLFESLRRDLMPLVIAIADVSRRAGASVLRQEFPIERQRILAEMIAAAVGFNWNRGRLDVSAHPFCTDIGPGDCRITTRYQVHDFSDAFFSVLHEVGHALYEQGLDPAHAGTPMGEAVSLGVHESQSRLWENAVGRSHAFWKYVYPLAQRVFHEALSDVPLDTFHRSVNLVEPSLVRVQADEVTYNLHIIIRFELEQALLAGDLAVGDLPGAWSEKYEHYLNITPLHDAEGCLQDVHWSAGLFGYFPTYTLGNVFGAQLFARMSVELADAAAHVSRGAFGGLLDWLRDKVHRHGKRFRSVPLITRATGEAPNPRHLVDSLRIKYQSMYYMKI